MKKKIFLFTFIPTFILYLATAPSTVYWQDSGIYLGGVKSMGIILPPGYPLYLLATRLWIWIFKLVTANQFSFSWYVHSFSGLAGSVASAVVSLTVLKVIAWIEVLLKKADTEFKYSSDGKRMVISISSGLACGVSYSLWSQSINSEVYSLVGLFTALIFYKIVVLVIDIYRSREEDRQYDLYRSLMTLAVLISLSFTNHPLAVFITVPVLIFLYRYIGVEKVKRLGIFRLLSLIIIPFLTVAIFYSFLFIRSSASPYYLWSKIDSLKSFWDHVRGSQYYQGGSPIGLDVNRLKSLPSLFFEELLIPSLLILIVGIRRLFKMGTYTKILLGFAAMESVSIIIASVFYKTGGTEYNYWLIPVYIILYVIVGIGIWSLFNTLQSTFVSKTFLKKYRLFGEVLLLIAVVTVPFLFNIRYNNRSKYILPEEFGKNILTHIPDKSILFVVGDQDASITKYLQLVEDYKKDIVLVLPTEFRDGWRIEHLKKIYPWVEIPKDYEEANTQADLSAGQSATSSAGLNLSSKEEKLISEFIDLNIDKYPVYLIQKNLFDTGKYKTVPAGTIWRLGKNENEPLNLSDWKYTFSDPERYNHPEKLEGAKRVYDVYGNVGAVRQKYTDEAKNFELQGYKNLADVCFEHFENQKPLLVKNEIGILENFLTAQLLMCARDNYEKMVNLDPQFYRVDIWERRAKVYTMLGDSEKAREIEKEAAIKGNTLVR